MAVITYKNLGQVNPASGALTTLYTAPAAGLGTVSSTVYVCNTSTSMITFRLSHAIAGAADARAQYLYYDEPLGPNLTFAATVGITLGANDVLRVQSNSPLVAFNVYGAENT